MKTKILIVEDEKIIARDTQMMLETMGYEVTGIAGSHNEAIKRTKERKPDLILMDIKIRGSKDGIDTAMAISNFVEVPIIFVTAFSDDELLQRAIQVEPFGYILKPFQEKELYFSIEMALFKFRMENELKVSREKFQKLFEQSNDAVFIHMQDGSILDLNSRACEMLGYEKTQLLNLNISDFIEASDKKLFSQAFKETHIKGFDRFEVRFIRNDRIQIDVEISARIIDDHQHCVQSIIRDITERKQIEAQIKKMNVLLEERVRARTEEIQKANEWLKKLSLAVEQSPSMVYITDRKGQIEYINPKFIEITKYKPKQVIGRNPKILNAGQNPKSLYADLWKTIRDGRVWTGDLCDRRKDKSIIWMHTSISPIMSDDGEITHFVALAEDITKRRWLDEELKEHAKELEMFNKSMVNREIRLVELKEEVNALLNELGREIKYPPVWEKTP